jgi:hypothetical protein
LTDVDVLREQLLGEANNDLAIKHQNLNERQQNGRNVGAATAETQTSLERVEALQEGVTYKIPKSALEALVSEEAAKIITLMLDGEGAAGRHLSMVLGFLDKIFDLLPEEEAKRWIVFRQGPPMRSHGQDRMTATTRFENTRIVKAKDKDVAIEKLVKRGDEESNETERIEDGEILVVVGLKNRQIEQDTVWVEEVRRPIFQGAAPRDNTKDERWAGR